MPSSTFKQKRTMAGACHDPKFAKKVGIPKSVACDFNRADTGRTPSYSAGGAVNYYRSPGSFAEGGPPLPRGSSAKDVAKR